MANEWKETTLDELVYFRNGKSLNNRKYNLYGKYPVWGANGQINRTDEILNSNPVIVIGRVGAYCGSVNKVNEPNWVTDNAIFAIPKSNYDFDFIYYLFKYLKFQKISMTSLQKGTKAKNFNIIKPCSRKTPNTNNPR
jgi:type I restriction enzyme S subunit